MCLLPISTPFTRLPVTFGSKSEFVLDDTTEFIMALTYIIVGRYFRLYQIGLPAPFFVWLDSAVGKNFFLLSNGMDSAWFVLLK